jgi:adenylyltransferase/sulfurtransferase
VQELIDYEQFCGIGPVEDGRISSNIEEITVSELSAAMARGDDVTLLDVREPHEYQICHIDGGQLLPLSELQARMHELDTSRRYYVHCKSGVRSVEAIERIQEAGFTRLKNVAGGIAAWAEQIDPTMPTY